MEGAGTRSRQSVAARAGTALACALLLFAATAVQAQQRGALPADADVPPPGYAHVLPMRPQARMLADGETCELIAGILTSDGELLQGGVALYRDSKRGRHPFMRVTTREDGLIVAHFKAKPNDVVVGRPYWWDMRDMSNRQGPRVSTLCRSGSVSLGEPHRIPPGRTR
ncbi:hypothetical protein ACOPJQ_02910 [Luteimonas dalianensis]